MKSRVVNFFLSVLLGTWGNLCAQEDTTYTSLEDALAVHPDSVFRLDLSKSKFNTFPVEIYRFPNLIELSLSKCKLTALPADFTFAKLQDLDLSKNQFLQIPPAVCKIHTLKNLWMGRNRLTAIPECIAELKQLDTLDIWFNNITEIPDTMLSMRKLKFLDLRGMNYTNEFQELWRGKLPWVKIEFNLGCDCGH